MFLQYYGLREQPFGVTPDPRYLYPSMVHREALASLVYSFESELGFASLIAEPGVGKTTLLYSLLERFGPSTRNAYIFETQCESRELLRHLLSDLEADTAETDMNAMFRRFRDVVADSARTGRRLLIIIDEAQNLAEPVLETIRLLSNFETSSSKLVHIVLAGQLQLAQVLARPEMAQLRQRITIATRLRSFSPSEVGEYIEYRLNVAGYRGAPLFTEDALTLIAQQSRGIPREINRICFNAMSLGFALERRTVDGAMVEEAGADLDLGPMLATSAPRMLSPAPSAPQEHTAAVPPRASAALPPRAAPSAPVLPATERQPANPLPGVTAAVSASARSFAPAPMAPASGALDVSTTTAPSQPPRQKLEPVGAHPATAPIPVRSRAFAPERPHVPVPQVQSRTRLRRAATAGALLVVLIAMAAAFGGRMRSAIASQRVRTVAQTSGAPGRQNRTAPPPAQQAADVPATNRADIPAPRNTYLRMKSPANPVARQTATAQWNSEGSEIAPSSIAVPSPTTSRMTAVEGSASVKPPPMTVDAGTIAAVPALPGPSTADVPSQPIPRAAAPENISPGRLLTRIEPRYPAAAREAHIQGSVVLSAHIGKDGRVTAVHTLEGNSLLAQAAADAVRRWVYTPYTLNGQAVEVDTKIVVKFIL